MLAGGHSRPVFLLSAARYLNFTLWDYNIVLPDVAFFFMLFLTLCR